MAGATQVIIAGFTDELPWLSFATKFRHFRHSENTFYKEVYDEAVQINKKFADILEICVVR